MLTHFESPRVTAHFERLRRETAGILDAFLCVHRAVVGGISNDAPGADFRVRSDHGARLLPKRYLHMFKTRRGFNRGFPDLAYMPVLTSHRLASYRYIWLIEFDVDYAGSWSRFFSEVVGSRADLLTTILVPRHECPDWIQWRWFAAPQAVSPAHYTRSFNPIVRFSRRMLRQYLTAVDDPGWRGHTEALYPTIALHHGLTIEDIGGGPFCPAHRRGGLYRSKPHYCGPLPETVVFRPPIATAYFHEDRRALPEPDLLYHPVKIADSQWRASGRDLTAQPRQARPSPRGNNTVDDGNS